MRYIKPWNESDANASYVDGDPVHDIEGSIPPAESFEDHQRELVALIAQAGLTPTHATLTQVRDAVRYLIQRQAECFAGVAGGSANALTGTLSPAPTAYTTGMPVRIIASASNGSGACTLALNGLAAKAIKRSSDGLDPYDTYSSTGDLWNGMVADLVYDGTVFQLINSRYHDNDVDTLKLLSDRDYYVNSDSGNDANTGLDTSHPFLTITHAINVMNSLNLNGHSCLIHLMSCSNSFDKFQTKQPNGGKCFIAGTTTTPTNHKIVAAGQCIWNLHTDYDYQYMYLASTGRSGSEFSMALRVGGQCSISNLEFGPCSDDQISVEQGGNLGTGHTPAFLRISGGGNSFMSAVNAGSIIINQSILQMTTTVTYTTAFARAMALGVIDGNFDSYVNYGYVTATKYDASYNAIINHNGSGTSHFPGGTAGTTSTGGQAL